MNIVFRDKILTVVSMRHKEEQRRYAAYLLILLIVAQHSDPSMYMAFGPRSRFENQVVP